MLGGAPLLKLVTLVSLELTALFDLAALVRLLSCLTIAWLFVIAFGYRRLGLTGS